MTLKITVMQSFMKFVDVLQIFLILVCLPCVESVGKLTMNNEVKNKRYDAAFGQHDHPSYIGKMLETPQRKIPITSDLSNRLKKSAIEIIVDHLNDGIKLDQRYSQLQPDKEVSIELLPPSENRFRLPLKKINNEKNERYTKPNRKRRVSRSLEDELKQNKSDQGKLLFNITTENPLGCAKHVSCLNSCDIFKETNRSMQFRCQCDSDCELFKDCCADYQRYCKAKQLSYPRINIDQKLFSCLDVDNVNYSIWTVSKCPKEWKRDEIYSKCENLSLPINGYNVRSHVPVIGENRAIFRNEYCAQCNKARVFDYFGLKINSSIRLDPPADITTIEGIVLFAIKYCEVRSISIFRKKNQQIRNCLSRSINVSENGDPRSYTHCKKTSGGIFSIKNGNCDENIWCSGCWNEQPKDLECGPIGQPECLPGSAGPSGHSGPPGSQGPPGSSGPTGPTYTASYSMAMDFESNIESSPTISCRSSDYFYDHYLKICRPSLMSDHKYASIDRYFVVIWLKNSSGSALTINNDDFMSSFEISFGIPSSQVQELEIESVPLHKFAVSFEILLLKEEMLSLAKEVALIKGNQSSSVESKSLKKYLPLKSLLFFTKEFNMTISNVTFTIFDATSRQLACLNGRKFSRYTLLQNGQYYINSTGETFPERQVYFESNTAHSSITVCKNITFSMCKGTRFNLKTDEYVSYDNLSILLKTTNTTLHFGEYDIENGTVVVCGLLPDYIFSKQSINQRILGRLTFVAFIISIMSLCFVILTYTVFSELRNLPGKNILNLSTSLNLTQILWLAANNSFHASAACHVIAVMEHYLHLVSFVAMAIIAFHSRSVFASKQILREVSKSKENKKFLKFSAIVWGIPAIFVGTCTFIDYRGVYVIYVSDKVQACWFNNKEAHLYLFVLPVGLILAFNIVFFVSTVVHISRQRAESGLLSTLSRPKTILWVYIKLSTLMGFSWLFGYLDILISPTPVFSYLFVIFASLQGFYIAVAFLLNKRVLNFYGQLLRKLRNKSEQPDKERSLTNNDNTRETRV